MWQITGSEVVLRCLSMQPVYYTPQVCLVAFPDPSAALTKTKRLFRVRRSMRQPCTVPVDWRGRLTTEVKVLSFCLLFSCWQCLCLCRIQVIFACDFDNCFHLHSGINDSSIRRIIPPWINCSSSPSISLFESLPLDVFRYMLIKMPAGILLCANAFLDNIVRAGFK